MAEKEKWNLEINNAKLNIEIFLNKFLKSKEHIFAHISVAKKVIYLKKVNTMQKYMPTPILGSQP